MKGKEFALKLVVGVSDLASKKFLKLSWIAKKLEKNLNNLQKTSKNIEAFQKYKRDLDIFNYALINSQRASEELKNEIQQLEKELKETEKEFNKTGQSSLELKNKIETLKREIENKKSKLNDLNEKIKIITSSKNELENKVIKLKQELQKEGIEIENLSEEYKRLRKEIEETANKYEEFEKKLSTSSLDTIGARLKKIAALGGIGATSGAFLKGIIDNTKELETEARKIIATTDLTIDKLDEVKQHILDLRAETNSSMEEISEVYAQLAQQTDLEGEKLKEAAAQILKLRKLKPDWDTKEITRAITQMQKAWGISSEEAGDLLITALQKAGDKADDLLDTFWEYAPLMKEAGLNAKEFTAILIAGAKEGAFNYDKLADTIKESFKARLTDQGEWEKLVGKGTKKGVIDEMLPEGKLKEKARRIKHYLAQIREGFETGDDKKKKEGYAKLLTELSILYKQDAQKARTIMEHIFGTQGTDDISAKILKAMGEATLNSDKIVGNYKGALDKAYNESQTFFDKLNIAWTKLENTFIKAFDKLGHTLAPIGDIIVNITEKMSEFGEQHPLIMQFVIGFIALIATLGVVGATFQTLALISSFSLTGLTSLLGITTTAFKAFGTAAMFTGRALMLLFANPIGLAILGITALIMAIIYLYKNWDNVWSNIKSGFKSAIDFLISGFNFVKNIFLKGLKFIIDFSPIGLFLKAINFMTEKITGIDLTKEGKRIIKTLTDGILSFIKKPLEILEGLKNKVKGIFSIFGIGDDTNTGTKLNKPQSKRIEKIQNIRKSINQSKLTKTEKVIKKDIHINVSMPNINAKLNISQETNPEKIKEMIIQAFREGSTELKWAIEQALKEIQYDNEGYIN